MADPEGSTPLAQPGGARLRWPTLLAFGLPALPLTVVGVPLVLLVVPLYAQDLGVSAAAVALVFALARLFDGVIDPAVGILSDRYSSRFGRRRPWVVLGTPVLVAGIWLVFLPGASSSATSLMVSLVILYLGWSLVILPYAAWGAELSSDYRERTQITSVRQVFLMLGTVAAVVIQAIPALLGSPGTAAAMSLLGITAMIAIPLAILVLIALVPEPERAAAPAGAPLAWRDGLRLIAGNAPFRRLLGAYFLNAAGGAATSSLFVFYVTHVLKAPEKVPLFLLSYFAAGILGAPLWVWLARRHDKHRVWVGSMLWACAWFACVPLLGPDHAWLYLVVVVATGISLGADYSLPASMNADVIDLDTAQSGKVRTGLFIALWEMASKAAQALGVAVALPLVASFGFAPANPDNGPVALQALSVTYALVPALLALSSIVLMWRFPLGAEAHAAVRARLALNAPPPAA